METAKKFENFPVGTVIRSNVVSLAIYGFGFAILYRLGLVYSLLFTGYILFFEFRLIRYHCTRCYYWGKTCGFGKGRVSGWLFKKGDPEAFCNKAMTWKDLIPDMLIILIPLISGIALLIFHFNFILLAEILLLGLLMTSGNGYVRGSLTCKYCKQQENCPAFMLFNKPK
jgi:hypothetical protein